MELQQLQQLEISEAQNLTSCTMNRIDPSGMVEEIQVVHAAKPGSESINSQASSEGVIGKIRNKRKTIFKLLKRTSLRKQRKEVGELVTTPGLGKSLSNRINQRNVTQKESPAAGNETYHASILNLPKRLHLEEVDSSIDNNPSLHNLDDFDEDMFSVQQQQQHHLQPQQGERESKAATSMGSSWISLLNNAKYHKDGEEDEEKEEELREIGSISSIKVKAGKRKKKGTSLKDKRRVGADEGMLCYVQTLLAAGGMTVEETEVGQNEIDGDDLDEQQGKNRISTDGDHLHVFHPFVDRQKQSQYSVVNPATVTEAVDDVQLDDGGAMDPQQLQLVNGNSGNGGVNSYNRREKSLEELSKKFLTIFLQKESMMISLDKITQQLDVERRRIYDIINILESLKLVTRRGKNNYKWNGFDQIFTTIGKFQSQQLLHENEDENAFWLLQSPQGIDFSEKKEKSLEILSIGFLKLFLKFKETLSLEEAARKLSPPCCEHQKIKTKIRRLYDIANVFKSLGLIRKVQLNQTKKPAFQWVGISGLQEFYNSSKDADPILGAERSRTRDQADDNEDEDDIDGGALAGADDDMAIEGEPEGSNNFSNKDVPSSINFNNNIFANNANASAGTKQNEKGQNGNRTDTIRPIKKFSQLFLEEPVTSSPKVAAVNAGITAAAGLSLLGSLGSTKSATARSKSSIMEVESELSTVAVAGTASREDSQTERKQSMDVQADASSSQFLACQSSQKQASRLALGILSSSQNSAFKRVEKLASTPSSVEFSTPKAQELHMQSLSQSGGGGMLAKCTNVVVIPSPSPKNMFSTPKSKTSTVYNSSEVDSMQLLDSLLSLHVLSSDKAMHWNPVATTPIGSNTSGCKSKQVPSSVRRNLSSCFSSKNSAFNKAAANAISQVHPMIRSSQVTPEETTTNSLHIFQNMMNNKKKKVMRMNGDVSQRDEADLSKFHSAIGIGQSIGTIETDVDHREVSQQDENLILNSSVKQNHYSESNEGNDDHAVFAKLKQASIKMMKKLDNDGEEDNDDDGGGDYEGGAEENMEQTRFSLEANSKLGNYQNKGDCDLSALKREDLFDSGEVELDEKEDERKIVMPEVINVTTLGIDGTGESLRESQIVQEKLGDCATTSVRTAPGILSTGTSSILSGIESKEHESSGQIDDLVSTMMEVAAHEMRGLAFSNSVQTSN